MIYVKKWDAMIVCIVIWGTLASVVTIMMKKTAHAKAMVDVEMNYNIEWYQGKPKKTKKDYNQKHYNKEYQHEYYLKVRKPKLQEEKEKNQK